MDPEPYSSDGAPHGKENPLPVSEPAPAELPVKASELAVPTATQQYVGPSPNQNPGDAEKPKEDKPILVIPIEDDQLSSFEQKTINFGKWGLVIAAISLIAASLAAWFVRQQFIEVAAQTDLLSRSAKQARKDSSDSSVVASKQIGILQKQLIQSQEAFNVTERAWAGIINTAFKKGKEPAGLPLPMR